MSELAFSAITYRTLRDRIKTEDPTIDEQTLADTVAVSLRAGLPALQVINEDAVPSIYWQPGEPRLKRHILLTELKDGQEIEGVALSNPEPVLSVRTR